MSAIRVRVTSEQIAAAGDDVMVAWCSPVEAALAELTGQEVSIDGGEGGCIAAIGQGAWTIVVDLPAVANDWLDRRWDGGADGLLGSEPFEFDLEVPDWLVAFLARAQA